MHSYGAVGGSSQECNYGDRGRGVVLSGSETVRSDHVECDLPERPLEDAEELDAASDLSVQD